MVEGVMISNNDRERETGKNERDNELEKEKASGGGVLRVYI